jgi:carboxypeptidase family protein
MSGQAAERKRRFVRAPARQSAADAPFDRPQHESSWMHDALTVMLIGLMSLRGLPDCAAQKPLSRSASIVGQVRDTAREPVRRANVCAFGERRRAMACVMADTAGVFRLDSLLPDTYTLQIECETNAPGYSKALARRRVETVADGVTTADIKVVPIACDQRRYEVVRGELTGHWASGFELDDFVPCQDSSKHASVERKGLRPGELWQLPAGEDYGRGTRWFVRWRGALIGPRGFTTRYRMVVEDVLEMRVPTAEDCKP